MILNRVSTCLYINRLYIRLTVYVLTDTFNI